MQPFLLFVFLICLSFPNTYACICFVLRIKQDIHWSNNYICTKSTDIWPSLEAEVKKIHHVDNIIVLLLIVNSCL